MSETTETVDSTTTETTPPVVTDEEKGILRDLQAERAKRQSISAELEAMKKANEEAETARLTEQNKFQELYEAEKAKVADYEPVVNKYNDYMEAKKTALLEKLGDDADDFKGLEVPALEKVVEKLTKLDPPSDPGRPGTTPAGEFGGYKSMRELALAVARGEPGTRELYDSLKRTSGGA